MTEPLTQLVPLLLKSKKVQRLLRSHYGESSKEMIRQFRAGEFDDLLDLFENNKWELSEGSVDTIDAAAPADDVFEIEIRSVGGVYWIWAPEHGHIGYFRSRADAESYAEDNFEPFITELHEREDDESD